MSTQEYAERIGFTVPKGTNKLRQGDDVIAANAVTAAELIRTLHQRVDNIDVDLLADQLADPDSPVNAALADQIEVLVGSDVEGRIDTHVTNAVTDPTSPLHEAVIDIASDVTDGATAALLNDASTAAGGALREGYVADQTDFVELVRDNSPRWTAATFRKVAVDKYQVRYHDGERGITYQLVKDPGDSFIKLDACYAGYGTVLSGSDVLTNPGDLTGAWNVSSASWYTTAVGATFTANVTGSRITLRLIKEARGGLWHISIDGGAPIPVSCWDAVTTGTLEVVLATGLSTGSHTVVGTFQGDDPAHPPASSPSRGYVRNDASGAVVGYITDAAQTSMILADGSNKEFAWTAKIGTAFNWIPEHDAIPSAIAITAPVFVINGAVVDVGAMAIGASLPLGSGVELRQHFHGRIAAAATNALEFHTTHRLDPQGLLSFSGRFVALVAVEMLGYPLMLPAKDPTTSRFVTGIGNAQDNDASETQIPFTDERDDVFSAAVVSPTNTNLIAAGTLRNPRLTYRRGQDFNRAPDNRLFVWHRATKPKLYWSSCLAWPMAAGEAYAWAFDLMVGDIPGIYRIANPPTP